jgi:hypothetical protein
VFNIRFPDINSIEGCLVPVLDEHNLVYTLSDFMRGVVQKDVCVLGNNSVYFEDIHTRFFLNVDVNPNTYKQYNKLTKVTAPVIYRVLYVYIYSSCQLALFGYPD